MAIHRIGPSGLVDEFSSGDSGRTSQPLQVRKGFAGAAILGRLELSVVSAAGRKAVGKCWERREGPGRPMLPKHRLTRSAGEEADRGRPHRSRPFPVLPQAVPERCLCGNTTSQTLPHILPCGSSVVSISPARGGILLLSPPFNSVCTAL